MAHEYGLFSNTTAIAHESPSVPVTAIYKLVRLLTPASPTYVPGGATIKMTLSTDPDDYLTFYAGVLSYRWKVFGAGNSTITDGKTTGTDFESDATSVQLKTPSSASGVQTVSVELFIDDGNTKRSVGKATANLNSQSGDIFAFAPNLTEVKPGGQGGFTVSRNGKTNVNEWTGVNPAHLRFTWVLQSGAVGLLKNGTSTGLTLETTTNTIAFTAKEDVAQGQSDSVTVTVRVQDPVTGQFTNLGTATSTVVGHVKNTAQVTISNSNFSLSQLAVPTPIQNFRQDTTFLSRGANGWVVGGNYHGFAYSSNAIVFNLRPGSVPKVGDRFNIIEEVTNDQSSIAISLYDIGASRVTDFVTQGNALITEIISSPVNGDITYMRLAIALTCTSTSGRSMQASIDVGVGSRD
jgi:hypothetical protein